MKISPKGESKYLTKIDVPNPIVAAIQMVRIETLQNPREDKPILHFQGNGLKPMVLNVTNRRVLIAAYGDETDDWRGRPVEIYVNNEVTNSSGEVVGGVRVRIPAARPAQQAPQASVPTRPANVVTQQKAPPLSDEEAHAKILNAFLNARTVARLDEWATWGKNGFSFTREQDDEQSDAYHLAKERLDAKRAPADNSIPF